MVEVKAIVIAGRGIATELRAKETKELSKLLGIALVSGSLNLVARRPLWLDSKSTILSTEQGHMYWKATLQGIPVIVNRWEGDCPAHIYEIYADVRLRGALELYDGDEVCLSFDRTIVDVNTSKSLRYLASWYLTWLFREKMYYRSDKYLQWIKRKPISKFTWRAMQM